MITRIRTDHGQGCITGTALVNFKQVYFVYSITKNTLESSNNLSTRQIKRLLTYIKQHHYMI